MTRYTRNHWHKQKNIEFTTVCKQKLQITYVKQGIKDENTTQNTVWEDLGLSCF